MRFMKSCLGCFAAIGVVTILAIIALFVGYYFVSLTPPIREQMTPVTLSAEAAQSLSRKTEAFQLEIDAAVREGKERQATLVITEEEVNSRLVELLAEDNTPVKEIMINFRKGALLRYWVFDTPVFKAKIAARTKLEAAGSKTKMTMEETNLGKLPLTPWLNQRAGDIMAWTGEVLTGIITVPGDLPLQITTINIEDGQITVNVLAYKK